jgi:hypothetical protein
MKKLMTLTLGLALVFTTVGVTYAQETPKKNTKKNKSKGGKKKAETPKKEGSR